MTESLLTTSEKARNAHSRVLQAMQTPGKGGAVAAALGFSDSTVSRMKTEHLEPALLLIHALGFKVVPQDSRCIDPATYDFLTAKHAHVMRVAPELIWGSDE